MSDTQPRARTAIGELIHAHRSRRGWSRGDLATRIQLLASTPGRTVERGERLNMHPNTIANWETRVRPGEKSTIPQINTLRRVAEVFGFAPDSPEYRALFAARHEAELARRSGESGRDSPTSLTVDATPAVAGFVEAGREAALHRLDALAREARAGNSRLAMIHAEPGAGKSALVRAFLQRLRVDAAAALPVMVVIGCKDDGRTDGLAPARDGLAAILGLHDRGSDREEDAGSASLAIVDAAIAANLSIAQWPLPTGALERLSRHPGVSDERRAIIAAAIAEMRSHPVAGEEAQAEAWADAIVAAARSLPAGLVLVVEDLHWAPSAMAAALSALIDRMTRTPGLPLLLVLTWRPADLHDPRFGTPHPALAPIADGVARFPDGDIDLQAAIGGAAGRDFVEATLRAMGVRDPSPAFVTALAARTNGLPLFVVGMIRLLTERGVFDGEDAVGTRDIDWSEVPHELEALFRDRLDRLDQSARDILVWASVQGEQFAGEPLFAALELDRDLGFEILDRDLSRRWELMTFVGQRSTDDHAAGRSTEHVWSFSHALLREFAWQQMTPFERRRAHLRTAEALLAVYGDGAHPQSERIAWHLEQAGDLARAATAWVRAGDQAVTEGDVIRADRHFAHVEAMGAAIVNPPMLAQSLLGRSHCARSAGDGEAALQYAELGVTRARDIGDLAVVANALQIVSTVRFDQGRHLEGIAALQEAQPILAALGDPIERCRIECLLAFNLIAVGHYDEAMTHATLAVARAADVGTDRVGITALVAKANVLVELGRYEDALAIYGDGVTRARAIGTGTSEVLCWVNIGLCHAELGDDAAAASALGQVHERARDLPVMGIVAATHFDAAILAESMGRFDEAERAFSRSLEFREEIGQYALQIDSLAGLLRVAVARGEVATVTALLDPVEERLGAGGLMGSEHHGRLFLAVIRGNRLLGHDEREAEVAREAVAFLRGRLEHIGDPSDRRSYLMAVPSHRVLVAEIGDLLGIAGADLLAEGADEEPPLATPGAG
ncbi:MAG: AAA family ATPase [Thermomicrobiales bacterium]